MAGTRLLIVLVFSMQTMALVYLAAHWTGDDLIWKWWNLWMAQQEQQQQQQQLLLLLLQKEFVMQSATRASIGLPTWHIKTRHPEEWKDLIEEYNKNKKNPYMYDIRVTPCCSNEDGDDSTCEATTQTTNNNTMDLVDLWDCSNSSSNDDDIMESVIWVQEDRSLVLESVTPRYTRQHLSRQLLLPPRAAPLWSVRTCLAKESKPATDPPLEFNVWVLQDDQEMGIPDDSWNLWLHWLDQARRRTQWFSSSTTTTTSARVNVQTISMQQKFTLLDDVNDSDETTSNPKTCLISPESISSLHSQQQRQQSSYDTDETIVVHLLIPPQHNNHRFVLKADQDTLHEKGTVAVASLDNSLVVLLPTIPTKDQDDSKRVEHQAAYTVLRHIAAWKTRNCLGIGLGSKQEDTLHWSTANPSSTNMPPPTWWSKLLWHRALSELYPVAWSHAQDSLTRYEQMKTAAVRITNFSRDPWMVWLQGLPLPDPRPLWTTAAQAVQQVRAAQMLAQQGQWDRAVQQLLSSTTTLSLSSTRQEEEGLLTRLILDYSIDQYLAMVAPLLVPMILPALVALIRETKRFRRLTKTTTARLSTV